MPRADDIAAAARAYLDVPFRHQGRSRAGVDCAGLIICAARDLGVSDFEYRSYGRQPDGDEMAAILKAHLVPIRRDRPRAGAVAHLRITTRPQHLGLLLPRRGGGLNIIHAYEGVGRVVEHIFDAPWRRRLVGLYRFGGG